MKANIKIHGWQAVEVPADARLGEENACLISFRLANVKGLPFFLQAFSVLKGAGDILDFNGCAFVARIAGFFGQLYAQLKRVKNQTGE